MVSRGKRAWGGKPNWTVWDEPGGWLYERDKDPFQLDNLFFDENFESHSYRASSFIRRLDERSRTSIQK